MGQQLAVTTLQVLEDIAKQYGLKYEERLKKDPDAYLLALLREIRRNMLRSSSTTWRTVESGGYEDSIRYARRLLNKEAKTLSQAGSS